MREATVFADFSKRLKEKIKPLHGVNNSPVSLYNPPPGFKEAGIPFCRLHDSAGPYGGSHYVDIPNVFPDFDADPGKPESYDFAFTDAYLTQLHAAGTEIFYRLGVTIENNYRIKGYHNHPPRDFRKWAEICAGIVRHYNCGWANGFKFGIKYWEIWNEPENPPMWDGTRHEFFELYRTASNRLKKEFPEIKVGGYGSCGFYVLTQPDRAKEPRFQLFMKWFEDFMKFVTSKKTACPLDFFSWHLYSLNPGEIAVHANYVDSKLKENGLKNAEIIFDEWNYVGRGFSAMKKAEGASFVSAAFCLMQDSPVDKAMYYDAYPQRRYCGLYYFPEISTTKTYSAFFLWNQLYRLGNRCKTGVSGDKICACAAADGSDKALFITNFSPESCKIVLDLKGAEPHNFTGLLVDNRHDRTTIVPQREIILPPFAVLLLRTSTDKIDRTVRGRKESSAFAGIDVAGLRKNQREMH